MIIFQCQVGVNLLTVFFFSSSSSFTRWIQTEPSGRYGCSWGASSAGVPTSPWAPRTHNLLEERRCQLRWQRWTDHSKTYHLQLWNYTLVIIIFISILQFILKLMKRRNYSKWLIPTFQSSRSSSPKAGSWNQWLFEYLGVIHLLIIEDKQNCCWLTSVRWKHVKYLQKSFAVNYWYLFVFFWASKCK